MKRFLKSLVPLFLTVGIIASIGWYLLVYDREFTRDMLISNARFFDSRGNTNFAATLYDLAYTYTGQDDDVAIELANQYRSDGNYTKAEYTLTHAIAERGSADLYIALSKTFVEQNKLMDAVRLLDSISDPAIHMELSPLRPEAPSPDLEAGFYSRYVDVTLSSGENKIYFTTDGDYPSITDEPFSEPISLDAGVTRICALSVAPNGLVSPLAVLDYTIGGVIEEAVFQDPAMELSIREALGVDAEVTLMTDRIWEITEFTVPSDAQNYEDLALMPYLNKLTFRGLRIGSLSSLSSLKELQELNLTECRFPTEDLQIIAQLPALEKLTISDCGLSTVAGLDNAQKLTYLDLSRNTLRNLDVLGGMTSLQELNLQHNAVTGLSALATLPELTKLDLSYNSVSDLTPLADCPKLSWLNVNNNALTAVNGVNHFPALSHLDVGSNKITDVTILGECAGLTELNISKNLLTSIATLYNLTNLVELNCSYNAITELPSWPDGSVLSVLDASYNEIESVYPLHNLEELTYVYMDYNKLTSVDPIADCYRLVMVNVYGNEIEDVSKLTEHNIIVNYDPTYKKS